MATSSETDPGATDINTMSRLDVIRLLGDVITDLDVLRANFDRGTQDRTRLDNLRDDLDTVQRKLVRVVISDNTKKFRDRSTALKIIDRDLSQTIADVDKVADTLTTLVKFLEAAQKIAELAP